MVLGASLVAALPALVSAAVAGALGLGSPAVVRRLPEPEQPAPASSSSSGAAETPAEEGAAGRAFSGIGTAPPKEPYVAIAALPGLRWWVAGASALLAGAFGARLGWTGALVYLVPLVPIGVTLGVIDWRTTLLPTRIIHPTYAALAVLVPLAALLDRDLSGLVRAAWGWLVLGGLFWVCWRLFGAWGFGDVRLARVLGPALGYLGWAQLLGGTVLMVLLGGVGGTVLAVARRSLKGRFAYGPAMLAGAALAVLVGPVLVRGLGY